MARRYRPTARGVFAVTGVLLIGAGIAVAARLGVFFVHSSTAGGALVRQERNAISGAGADGPLEAPSLGLVAPLLQGTGDGVLGEAVGHDPASVWPGQTGTSVLSAHDVTWFSGIAQLKPGATVRYVTPCWTSTFAVTAHVIVQADSPVYNTSAARLVLETCYPLDALYLTSSRYLLYAALVGSAPTGAVAAGPAAWAAPVVPAPAVLAAQGLTLAANSTPLGTLRLTGSPDRGWSQSSAPLNFETAALAAYFEVLRSAAQQENTWWADLAPSVPTTAAGPLRGGRIRSYGSPLTVTLRVAGTRAVAATLTATVTVSGSGGTGSYRLTADETTRAGKLLVTAVRVVPAP